MDRATLEKRLVELKRRKPFNPFVIVTAVGQRLEVSSSLSVAWGAKEFAVGLPNDTIVRFQPGDVVAIEAVTEEQSH